MLLCEVFDSPVKWEVHEKRPDFFEARFVIQNIPYKFKASAFVDSHNQPVQPFMWNIEFYPDVDLPDAKKYGITNTGYQQQVFATIVNIMKSFIGAYKPAKLAISALEVNRQKLYNRMISKLLPTWTREFDSDWNEFILSNPAYL